MQRAVVSFCGKSRLTFSQIAVHYPYTIHQEPLDSTGQGKQTPYQVDNSGSFALRVAHSIFDQYDEDLIEYLKCQAIQSFTFSLPFHVAVLLFD